MPFFPVIFSEGIEKVFHLDSFQILKCRSKKYYAFRECYLHIIINWSLLPNNISCSSIERDAHSFVCYHELSLDVRHFVCNSLWIFKIISNNEIGCLVWIDIKNGRPSIGLHLLACERLSFSTIFNHIILWTPNYTVTANQQKYWKKSAKVPLFYSEIILALPYSTSFFPKISIWYYYFYQRFRFFFFNF